MADLKMITKQQADAAAAGPINLHIKKPKADCVDSKTPFFCEYVKDEILGNPAFGKTSADRERLLYRGGLTIRTTLDMKAQADPMADAADLMKRYPKAQQRDFDGDPGRLTEMDALVAYLQVLGTMVDVNAAAAQEDLATERGR